tara:strand:+ start:350 stop:952 length:603 start_codon:yes stop_codon:yes gene_type:complete
MMQLLLLERKTLVKGWVLCFVVCLPFTFLPVMFGDGDLWQDIANRIPISLLYSAGFSTALCLSAVVINYDRQSIKLKLINKPAFKHLNAKLIPKGQGSLSEDLSFYLTADHNEFHYTIDILIDLEDHKKQTIVITPEMLEAGSHEMIRKYKDLLKKEYKVTSNKYRIELQFKPEDINLEDPTGLVKHLSLIEAKLRLKPV